MGIVVKASKVVFGKIGLFLAFEDNFIKIEFSANTKKNQKLISHRITIQKLPQFF